jgi:hypothetical protein
MFFIHGVVAGYLDQLQQAMSKLTASPVLSVLIAQ